MTFVLVELVRGLALLISLIFNMLYIILVVRIIMSWVDADPYNQIVQAVYKITDPMLEPFRRLPLQLGGIDFSPILLFLLLSVANNVITGILYRIAAKLG
jgi:YggT family protein